MARKVLILYANPRDREKLLIHDEVQNILYELEGSEQEPSLFKTSCRRARSNTFLQAIKKIEPEIIHFCGHGTESALIIEHQADRLSHPIRTDILGEVFEHTQPYVKCVLLNTCFSDRHAEAIKKHVPYVIGMRGETLDESAIEFARTFYQEIAKGSSIEDAFRLGRTVARVSNPEEEPTLFVRSLPPPTEEEKTISPIEPPLPNLLDTLRSKVIKFKKILLFVALTFLGFAIVLILANFFSEEPPTPVVKTTDPSSISTPDIISSGEKLLLPRKFYDQDNFGKAEAAAESFLEAASQDIANGSGDYDKVISDFASARGENSNNPEPYIYINNAKARQRLFTEGRKIYKLAVAVPASSPDNVGDRAEEILRGVADAQTCFNEKNPVQEYCPTSADFSIEIVIADDGNIEQKAKSVAREIASSNEIVGLIGHYASARTVETLPIYRDSGVPIISSASTSSLIQGDNFFRTTASTEVLGERLADYVEGKGVQRVFCFYDNKDDYSEDAWGDFTAALEIPFTSKQLKDVFESDGTYKSTIDDLVDNSNTPEKIAFAIFPASTTPSHYGSEEERNEKVESVAKQVKRLKQTRQHDSVLLVGGSAMLSSSATLEVPEFEDIVLAVPWFSDSSSEDRDPYAAIADKKWGKVNFFTASSYDAVQVFVSALSRIDNLENLSTNQIREQLIEKISAEDFSTIGTSGNDLTAREGEFDTEAVLVKMVSQRADPSKYKFALE